MRVLYSITFLGLILGLACSSGEKVCTNHQSCDLSTQRCLRGLDSKEDYQCRKHCKLESAAKDCGADMQCVQADCVTPDQGCWGICSPKKVQGCQPACKAEEVCKDNACVPKTTDACPKTKVRPEARVDVAGIFDTKRRRMVWFGGDFIAPIGCKGDSHPVNLEELWYYDLKCGAFQKVEQVRAPQGRARATAVYDEAGDRMLLFGGFFSKSATGFINNLQDLWSLDLKTFKWTEIKVEGTKPSPRNGAVGVYDEKAKEFVVFGGSTGKQWSYPEANNELWIFSSAAKTWKKLELKGDVPKARSFHAMTYDPKNQLIYLYGGGDKQAHSYVGDLWVLDRKKGTWSVLHAGDKGAPPGRLWPSLFYDPFAHRLLMFGGFDGQIIHNRNDTWAFDLKTKTWKALIKPPEVKRPQGSFCNFPPGFTENLHAPERRSGQLAVFDKVRREWILFGGKSDCGVLDDLWTFAVGQDKWSKVLGARKGETCMRVKEPATCFSLCGK
mgnify:CR=1 FL=1